MRRARNCGNPDRGETLIEVILAVAIIAITAVALMGSVLTSITSSGEHRTLAANDVYVKSYADAAQQQIQRQANPIYAKCATTYAVTKPSGIPASWTVGITSIKYWSGSAWSTSCSGDPAQLITVAVTSPTQLSTSLSFAVRDPNRLT
ncbi:MAG TPA: type II secretion system protein [Mycobacteriales bacterium]|nr:type II secretion system protein [Mycobacteriales bacterium]